MKKPKKDKKYIAAKQRRALKSAAKRKKFEHQKHLWNQGIGLYEIYTKEERDQSN
jgi:hypothetical protein